MNIKEAKEQIKKSVSVYLMKNADGSYRIPLERQRPIFLYGAPGIGKTAIMEQISEELGISLVAYSMTHHTRQSALGLPFITKAEYGGKEYDISRYTMSEIIAAIYDKIEGSGKKEGILFLDEINCVSETLAPSMLQFLQYKVFGSHRVPDGWVIVTAGNPPEFNRSVREFDVVTMDRLKVMEVIPDYDAWREYAVEMGIHKAVLSYLDIKRDDFYEIESTIDGKTYVTARGWEDLSEAVWMYEEKGYDVDESLVSQYLRNRRITNEFAAFYRLFCKYRADYEIMEILKGTESASVRDRAKAAGFDERITVTGLLLEALIPRIKCFVAEEKEIKEEYQRLKEEKESLGESHAALESFEKRKNAFNEKSLALKEEQGSIKNALSNAFGFVADVFGSGNEMLILITELTVNKDCALFINMHGCDEYFKYDKEYLVYERGRRIKKEVGI